MVLLTLTKNYFKWHYTLAFVDMLHIWKNITTFVFNFFSIPILFRTFFSPWKRIHADRETEGFDLFDWLSTCFVNLVMRIMGALMRSVLIIAGLLAVGVAVIGGFIFLAIWTIMPFIAILLLVMGVHLLLFK